MHGVFMDLTDKYNSLENKIISFVYLSCRVLIYGYIHTYGWEMMERGFVRQFELKKLKTSAVQRTVKQD